MSRSGRLASASSEGDGHLLALFLLPAGTAIAAAGILFPFLWWMAVVGLALFFLSLRLECGRFWRSAASGLFFGVVTGAAGVAWFWQVLPLDFLEIHNRSVQVAAVGVTWMYTSISLGLPVAIFAVIIRAFRSSHFFPLACAALWLLVEIARMWSFAVATWAPQSLLGPHFSTASIGYALAEQPLLLQLAHPLGLDALNFCAALMAGLLAAIPNCLHQPARRRALLVQSLGLLFLLVAAAFGPRGGQSLPSTKLRAAVVCESLDEVRNYGAHANTLDLLARAAAVNPPVDIVVMPEEISLTSMFFSKQEANDFLRTHFKTRDVLILNTRHALFPEEQTDSSPELKRLVYDGTTSGEVGRYVKHMLMPLGEYAPIAAKPIFSLFNDEDLRLYLEDVAAFPIQQAPLETIKFRGWRIGGLLCSDLLSPRLYRELAVRGKADVLVNLSNPFWFHGSRLLHWKTVQMAKVHAVQNRLPFILANNMAPSFALDSSGRVVAGSAWGKRDVLVLELPFPSN